MPLARFFSSSTMSSLAMELGGALRDLRVLVRGHALQHAGQRHRERRALVGPGAIGGAPPPVALDHGLHDEQAEPGAGVAAPDLAADAIEAIEDQAQVAAAHPDA